MNELTDTYTVPREKIDFCNANGHVTLRGICNAEEVEPYRQLIAAEIERSKATELGGVYAGDVKDRDTRYNAFLQFMNLWRRDEQLAQFILSKRLGSVAAQLLNTDAVRIYHDQALFKEPGAGYTPWHQDQFYWPLEDHKTITMWMPLTNMGSEMGTLVFADKSHLDGPMGDIEISDHSEAHFQKIIQERDYHCSISELSAGDATWHQGWTLHKAPGNTTDRMRQVMTIIFVAADAKILPPKNDKQQADLDAWMPGQQPGEMVGSELNPLVWGQ